MHRKELHNVAWILLALSVKYVLCQEPLPILELVPPDEADTIRHSTCVDGLVSGLDLFTVRGRVNKKGINSDAYVDSNLYLQAVKDPDTNDWESQCGPDLKVCGVNLNTDCYCERRDEDGYYHLVMRIMAKSIYSGGMLRLSWNDNRSPQNSPITSNIVDYYPGDINGTLVLSRNETRSPQNSSITSNIVDYYPGDINGTLVLSRNETRSPQNSPITSNTVDYYPGNIREKEFVTFKIVGTNGMILDKNLTHDDTKTIPVTYTPEMRNVTFCVFNLATNRSIQIEDGGDILVNTTTDPCVVLDLSETSLSRNLTITFMELEECEREGLYILTLDPAIDEEKDDIIDDLITYLIITAHSAIIVLIWHVAMVIRICKDRNGKNAVSTILEVLQQSAYSFIALILFPVWPLLLLILIGTLAVNGIKSCCEFPKKPEQTFHENTANPWTDPDTITAIDF